MVSGLVCCSWFQCHISQISRRLYCIPPICCAIDIGWKVSDGNKLKIWQNWVAENNNPDSKKNARLFLARIPPAGHIFWFEWNQKPSIFTLDRIDLFRYDLFPFWIRIFILSHSIQYAPLRSSISTSLEIFHDRGYSVRKSVRTYVHSQQIQF